MALLSRIERPTSTWAQVVTDVMEAHRRLGLGAVQLDSLSRHGSRRFHTVWAEFFTPLPRPQFIGHPKGERIARHVAQLARRK